MQLSAFAWLQCMEWMGLLEKPGKKDACAARLCTQVAVWPSQATPDPSCQIFRCIHPSVHLCCPPVWVCAPLPRSRALLRGQKKSGSDADVLLAWWHRIHRSTADDD
jgi:hypothetical protein